MNRLGARFFLLGGLCLGAASVLAGQVYTALVTHQSGTYLVEVDALISAPEAQVRAILTDYNHLNRVNPAIEVSEIIEQRAPGELTVLTETEACVWFYCMRVHQVQDVTEAYDGSITATVIPEMSDFRYGYARLNLWQEPDGTRVLVRSEVQPDFWIPPIIGPWLIKRKLHSEAIETVENLEAVAKQAAVPHNTTTRQQNN